MPIYFAQLSSTLTRFQFPMADEVNKDLDAVTREIKNTYLVKTIDLSLNADTIHFNTASQREMGKRFAHVVLASGL
jgi:hypothetical protein